MTRPSVSASSPSKCAARSGSVAASARRALCALLYFGGPPSQHGTLAGSNPFIEVRERSLTENATFSRTEPHEAVTMPRARMEREKIYYVHPLIAPGSGWRPHLR